MRLMSLRATVAAFAIAGTLLATTLAAEARTLRVSSWLPPSHPIVAGVIVPWSAAVAEATQGRVTIEILPAAAGSPAEHFDLAEKGVADITYSVHGYTPGRFFLFNFLELPFGSPSSTVMSKAYWNFHEKHLAQHGEHDGVKLLGLFTHGPGLYYGTEGHKVDSIDDFNGKKIRVGGGLIGEVAKALGTVPLLEPATKSYEILSNGVADGIFFPAESPPFFKIEEILRNGLEVPGGFYDVSFFLVMNQRQWDRLSDEDKAAIEPLTGAYISELAGKAWDDANAAGREKMAAAGLVIEPASAELEAALRERLAPVRDALIAQANERGLDGQALYQALQAEVAAAGGQ